MTKMDNKCVSIKETRLRGVFKDKFKEVKILIQVNIEYTYEQICNELGWKKSSGAQKQRQIACIEESYKFYHPINPKTKKEKKNYVFTKMIKEPILSDTRGGARESAGRKYLFPEEEFDYLWKVLVAEAYKRNKYYCRSWTNKIYFSNTLMFNMFGFSYSEYLDKAGFLSDDDVVKYIFQDIVYNALKANTITRICQRYNLPRNNVSKGILRAISKNKLNEKIDDDTLLTEYNEFEKAYLEVLGYSSVPEAVKENKYNVLIELIQDSFKEKNKFNVRKYNMIQVTDFDVLKNGECFGEKIIIEQYREHFRKVIFESVEKSCLCRINESKKYKTKLNDAQKKLLMRYLNNMLGKPVVIELNTKICYEEYAWLDKVI